MLDLVSVNLEDLATALEDHSDLGSWWIDPKTGKVEEWSKDEFASDGEDDESPSERGWRRIEPLSSRDSYADLEDFTALVRDRRARELLERSIAGRGAFRRFKDTLMEFPELRKSWFAFHDARMNRRAIEWLDSEGLLDSAVAERELAGHPEPVLPGLGRSFDAEQIARVVADDLRALYGERLRKVVLFGSWARGDAHPESDIDLLVILDRVDNPWREHERMDETLYRHSLDNDTVVSALVVSETEYASARRPVLIRARAEGQPIA